MFFLLLAGSIVGVIALLPYLTIVIGQTLANIVTTIISLNALAALPFGCLYRSLGLEAAMLARFAADIVLHVLGATHVVMNKQRTTRMRRNDPKALSFPSDFRETRIVPRNHLLCSS